MRAGLLIVPLILLVGCASGPPAGASPTPTVMTIAPAGSADATPLANRSPSPAAPSPTAVPALPRSSSAAATAAPKPAWRKTAPMPRERQGFDAVLLGDGTVLVVGNDRGPWVLDSESERVQGAAPASELVDLYDPSADAWTTAESLNKPRRLGAMAALPDGSAMVLGGISDDGEPFSSTKIYSPQTRGWTAGPLMTVARVDPRAVTLGDGRVLVVGATTHAGAATSEVYDPATGAWTGETRLPGLNAAVLALVPLGTSGAFALATYDEPDVTDGFPLVPYVFDSDSSRWTAVAPDGHGPTFWGTSFVGLADGDVLAVGGGNCGDLCGGKASHREVWRFDQQRHRWREAAPLASPRENVSLALLTDGRVLAAGGIRMRESDLDDGTPVKTTELYDPAANTWSMGPALLEASGGEWAVVGGGGVTAVVLADGDVLLLGGSLTTPERLTFGA